MYTRVLVPLDGSEVAEAVLPVAVTLAKADGAALRLLRIAEEPRPPARGETDVSAPADREAGRLRQEAEDYLQRMIGRLPGLPVDGAVRVGDPAEGILAEAEEWGADLIALATHGRSGLRRVVLGSVAQAVVTSALCEVLTLRPRRVG